MNFLKRLFKKEEKALKARQAINQNSDSAPESYRSNIEDIVPLGYTIWNDNAQPTDFTSESQNEFNGFGGGNFGGGGSSGSWDSGSSDFGSDSSSCD